MLPRFSLPRRPRIQSYRHSLPRALRSRAIVKSLIFVSCFALSVAPARSSEERPAGVPASAVFMAKPRVWVSDSDGKRTVYLTNGRKQAEGGFRGGKREGDWVFYYPNGNVRGRGAFQAGRMQGPWKLYHENAQTESTGQYEDNYRVGMWTFYTHDGRKRAEGMYHDGYRTGAWTEYYNSGKIFYTGSYVKNREHGEFKYYTEAGTVVQAGRFQKGARVGEWYICAGGMCGRQTFKLSEAPRFSGGVSESRGKSAGPRELLDVLDGKKGRRGNWD